MTAIGGAFRVVLIVLEHLRVGLLDVIALGERLMGDLPIARCHRRAIPRIAHLLEFEPLTQAIDRRQELLQRFGVQVHVDEDEAAPGCDLHGLQACVLVVQ